MVAAVFSKKGMEEDSVLIEYPPVIKKETLKNERYCTRQCYGCQETEQPLILLTNKRHFNNILEVESAHLLMSTASPGWQALLSGISLLIRVVLLLV